MSSKLRVRYVLDKMHGSSRAALRRLLPVEDPATPPPLETARYPSALLAFFPAPHKYACLGFLAEHMLRSDADAIVPAALESAVQHAAAACGVTVDMAAFPKVLKSKTTQPFLDLLVRTRRILDTHIRAGCILEGESEVSGVNICGHPDARTADQIFEIKLTGELKKNWPYFLCQLFAYAALEPRATDVYLVLPLQAAVVHFDVRAWANRAKFLKKLEDAAEKLLAPAPAAAAPATAMSGGAGAGAGAGAAPADPVTAPAEEEDVFNSLALLARYNIGSHMAKYPTLLETVKTLPSERPSQIFVGAPQSARFSVKDGDLTAAAAWIADKNLRVFIHAPYIINLSNAELLSETTEEHWAIKLLKKNLEVGAALGCKGVVVHVGKYTKAEPAAALEVMRTTLGRVLEAATAECPLLLETPAGQGTELLTGQAEFIEFVQSFDSPQLRICVDTCHVFACGHKPLAFVDAVLAASPDLLRLVHFNDSMDVCGSCKDRHAVAGMGKIGLKALSEVAERCHAHGIPMVIE
jgi:deoxyribonuclease-4